MIVYLGIITYLACLELSRYLGELRGREGEAVGVDICDLELGVGVCVNEEEGRGGAGVEEAVGGEEVDVWGRGGVGAVVVGCIGRGVWGWGG